MACILVVDDEHIVRQTFRLLLERAGHAVLLAENGVEAVAVAAARRGAPIDLFVIDIIMPRKDGVQTIIELRRINPTARILAVSGGGRTGNLDYLELARRVGAAAVLRKPVAAKALMEAVRHALSLPEAITDHPGADHPAKSG